MSEPLFSIEEKDSLAGNSMLYHNNLEDAKRYKWCSLQAGEALGQILILFLGAVEKIRIPRDVTYILSQLQKNSDIKIELVSEEIEAQKEELRKKIGEFAQRNKREVNRLRPLV